MKVVQKKWKICENSISDNSIDHPDKKMDNLPFDFPEWEILVGVHTKITRKRKKWLR